MVNILLLEPAYKNKYPPLGLMKIARYHREKGDNVYFVKGSMSEAVPDLPWDRIYITTLFTFEWKEVKKSIEEALVLCPDGNKIYVGGIMATLMPSLLTNTFPSINVVQGLLNIKGKLGYYDDECIDTLAPDYSILDQIDYKYAAANAYFAYTTRGCGRNCSFCAVKTLEPDFVPKVSIKEQIEKVGEEYGEKRDLRNLLLMDNNVLKSPFLRDIVDEIKDLGFQKGAKYRNPETGKQVRRIVDFNQGLDGSLITQEKARMLAEIELRPVRIAFDHIAQKESYVKAVKTCVKAGLRDFSNYILYNAEDGSSWKGHPFLPDTPADLYERLMINVELQEDLNIEMVGGDRVAIYSFPMRYIPLQNTERGFIGEKWNSKFLRAIQTMLTPTQGKGVSGRSFFSAAFGANVGEYMRALAMPEHLLAARGRFVETKEDETEAEEKVRLAKWQDKQRLIDEWVQLYDEIPEIEQFHEIIADNKFTAEKFCNLKLDIHKRLYLYYFTESSLLELLTVIDDENRLFVKAYMSRVGVILYKLLVEYINYRSLSAKKLSGFVKTFGYKDIQIRLNQIAVPSHLKQRLNEEDEPSGGQSPRLTAQPTYDQWEVLFNSVDKWDFIETALSGEITAQQYLNFKNKPYKRLYLHYLSDNQLIELLESVSTEDEIDFIANYCIDQCPSILETLARSLYSKGSMLPSKIIGFVRVMGLAGVNTLLDLWFNDERRSTTLLDGLEKAFITLNNDYADILTLRAVQEYLRLEVFSCTEIGVLKVLAWEGQYDSLRARLVDLFEVYSEKYIAQIPDDFTAHLLRRVARERLHKFYATTLARLM